MARRNRLLGAVGVAVVLGAVALAGCTPDQGGAGPTPTPTETTASASPTGPTTLRVAVYGDPLRLRTYQKVADAFVAENPGVEVVLEKHPDAASAAEAAVTWLGVEGQQDVFLADYRDFADLVATGGLEPLDTLLEERGLQFGDDYQRVALNAFSAESRLQCMPAEVSPLVVYVNTRLVRRSGPRIPGVELPDSDDTAWDWAEFVRVARTTAGLGPADGAYVPLDAETLTVLVRSAGGEVVDDLLEPTRLNLAEEEGVEAVRTLVSFARDESVSPTPAELAEADPLELFADGRLAMYVGTRDAVPQLRAARGLRFDVLPFPSLGRSRSVSTMSAYCVAASSEVVDVASDFVAFAVGERGARIAARSEVIVPSALSVLHDNAFTQPSEQPRSTFVFSSAVRRSDPLPYATAWSDVTPRVERLLVTLVEAPDPDLEATLERRLARLDESSAAVFGSAG